MPLAGGLSLALCIWGVYFFADYKRKEFIQDYQVSYIESEEQEKKNDVVKKQGNLTKV